MEKSTCGPTAKKSTVPDEAYGRDPVVAEKCKISEYEDDDYDNDHDCSVCGQAAVDDIEYQARMILGPPRSPSPPPKIDLDNPRWDYLRPSVFVPHFFEPDYELLHRLQTQLLNTARER